LRDGKLEKDWILIRKGIKNGYFMGVNGAKSTIRDKIKRIPNIPFFVLL